MNTMSLLPGLHLNLQLGLNWKAIGASVLVGTLVAIGTDLTLTFVKPRLFGDRKGKA